MDMSRKKIVVYYSYTGNTRMIAEKIAKDLNCDILELKPKVPYSNNYDEVVAEYQNNETAKTIPEIEKIDLPINEYDEIIIGSPVWWYTIAPVVRTFLKENDFVGKIIYPFATNAGWLGRAFKEIEELCPKCKVEEGMNILFKGEAGNRILSTPINEIDEWIKRL